MALKIATAAAGIIVVGAVISSPSGINAMPNGTKADNPDKPAAITSVTAASPPASPLQTTAAASVGPMQPVAQTAVTADAASGKNPEALKSPTEVAAPTTTGADPTAITSAEAAAPIVLAAVSAPSPVSGAPTPAPAPLAAAASTAMPAAATAVAVRGVSEHEIRFGMVGPFSGPSKGLGVEMKLGIQTAFNAANEAGGVNGRTLTLVTEDDGYEPARTGEAMKQLYDKDQVFGVVGNVGTPTAAVSVPYALSHHMVFFGGFSGGGLLRHEPPDRYVFNYRASYAEETYAVVQYLVKVRRLRPEQIAVFAQEDGYGDAGFEGVAKAMRQLRPSDDGAILRLGYKRNTVDVDEAVAQLQFYQKEHKAAPIKAVVMVSLYRAAAKFIEKTHDQIPGLVYTNVSGVGGSWLAEELTVLGPKYATGVIVTQVVPAVDSYASVVLDYKTALGKFFPGEAPDYVSFEGYLAANVLIEGLKRAGPDLDTEKLVSTLEGLQAIDMGLGTRVGFGRAEHQAVHKVWGTQLDATGHYTALDLE